MRQRISAGLESEVGLVARPGLLRRLAATLEGGLAEGCRSRGPQQQEIDFVGLGWIEGRPPREVYVRALLRKLLAHPLDRAGNHRVNFGRRMVCHDGDSIV